MHLRQFSFLEPEYTGNDREIKGLAEGAHEKALSTAKNMLAEGIASDIVAKCTDLPMDEIMALM